MTYERNNLQEFIDHQKKQESRIQEFTQKAFLEEEITEITPVYDMYLIDHILYLDVNLPGISEEEITVEVQSPYLYIRGEFLHPADITNEMYLQRKRPQGAFYFQFGIPTDTIIQTLDYHLTHGVLYLKIQLKEEVNQVEGNILKSLSE